MAPRQKGREQGIYRRVTVRMWGDSKVMALSRPQPCGQVLWVHLLTGEQTDIIPGLFKIGEAAFAEQLGWPLEGFRDAFREVAALGMAKADWAARVVWVPKAIEHNAPVSVNVVKSWADAWDRIPECPLKLEAWRTLGDFIHGMAEGFREAFREACPKPSVMASRIQEQEQEQDQEEALSLASAIARESEPSLDPEAVDGTPPSQPETVSGSAPHPAPSTVETPRDPEAAAPGSPGPHGAAGDQSPGPADAPATVGAARANAAGGGKSPAARDGGDAAPAGIAGEPRGAAGPAHPFDDELPVRHPPLVDWQDPDGLSPRERGEADRAAILTPEQAYPATAALVAALHAGGWPEAEWPKAATRKAFEARVARVTPKVAAARLLAMVERDRALGVGIRPWVSWHQDEMDPPPARRAAPRDLRVGVAAPSAAETFVGGEREL